MKTSLILLTMSASALSLGAQTKQAVTGQAAFADWSQKPEVLRKVIRLPMHNGKADGSYEDFLTGFVVDKNSVWGRPWVSQLARTAACSSPMMAAAVSGV
jgi:glucose/arabinose dehydrogenase